MDSSSSQDPAPIASKPERPSWPARFKKHRMRVLWTCVAVVVLAGVLVVAAALSIDLLAKAGIERAGARALGVETTLDSIKIGILSGGCTLAGFQVANPPDFKSSYFLRLDEGSLDVSLGNLLNDVVEIDQLTLSGVHLNLVREAEKMNFRPIIENIRQLKAAREAGEEEAGEGKGRKKFIIHEVVIQDISVDVDLLPFGGKLTQLNVPIEEIRLQDVGSKESKGENLSRVTAILVRALLDAVLAKGENILPSEMLDELSQKLRDAKPLETLQNMRDNMRELRDNRRERREEREEQGDEDRPRGPIRQRLRERALRE